MKKPISKTRRRFLNAFLREPNSGLQSAVNLWRGILPYSSEAGGDYWTERYYYAYYKGTKPYPGFKFAPLEEKDFEYIRSLVNIDPFLTEEENKEYIV